jgi:superfamily II DNA/RNA helicase
MDSLLLSLWFNCGLEWLFLDKADRLMDVVGLRGQVEQII